MASQEELLSIRGTVEGVVFYNEENGYVVLDLDCNNTLVTAVGMLGDVREGEELTLYGDYINSPKYGRQFKAEVFERSLPTSKEAIRKYLGSGVIPGIGPAVAKRIVTAFGDDTLEILENDSVKLAAIKGITTERALSIGKEFNKITGLRKAMTYFSKFGIQPITIASVWKQYEGRTMQVIKENPYIMCENGIELPFRDADRVAEALGIPMDSEERILAGIIWCLRVNAANGHTCVREAALSDTVCYELDISEKSFWSALSIAEQRGEVVLDDKYDERFVFLSEYYQAECYIAQKLAEMIKRDDCGEKDYAEEIAGIEWTEGIEYEARQKEAINGCMNNHVFILTGGPGTGKTTTLNAVIALCKQRGQKIKLAAPTGRAAKRMADLTDTPAQTIHRLLEVDFAAHGGHCFKRGEENPLSCDVLVIDEMSMVDTLLMFSLLKAVRSRTRLILVGDSNQLPSVGAGNILRDLIASGRVPMVELKEIFRQAAESLIVTNAHRIVRGEMPVLNDRKSDFFFMPTASEEDTLKLVIELCKTRLPNSYGYSAIEDIQVLCPSKLGVVGTQSINQSLQLALNPPGKGKQELKYFNQLFRTGDKIMQTKNDYDVEWRRGTEKSHGIFNGDIGIVRSADKANDRLEIDFDGRTAIYDTDMLKRVEHAYAVTIHKSQGSEYPAVIIPLPNGMDRLTYRNLLYTAVTRAKNILIVIGTARKVQSMVENDRRMLRYSCLRPMLEDHFV
ncbi:MAG: ATP-dependent RecD-like DNA helicase [Oscillospiraceae bacterium]|nr:ATP-dependent RecD-like DNA helicase [Oscillospiraceae bacterium]